MKRMVLAALLLAACQEEVVQNTDPLPLTPETLGHFCQMNLLEHEGPKGQVHLDGLPGAPLIAHSRERPIDHDVATSGAALDRPRSLAREAPTRAHAEPVREARPRIPSTVVNPAARTMQRILGAFVASAGLAIVLFGAMFVVRGGWQAAAAAGSIMAGIGALLTFLVAVTLADRR